MDTRDPDRFEDLPILADLRGLLADHMRAARPVTPRARTGWAVAGLRRIPLALAVAVAIAVVAVGLLALHHRSAMHHPSPPAAKGTIHPPLPANPPPTPGQKLANHVQHQVDARDHACSPPTNRGQTIDHGSPGQPLLSRLGVLRRPPLPPDPTNRVLYSIGWDEGAGVYVNYIRRARTVYGRSYWIVPEARTTPFGPIPARCYREFHSTLLHDLRHASPALRVQALAAERAQVQTTRAQTEHRAGLCFIEIGLHVRPHPGAVGFGCSPGLQGLVPGFGGNGSGDRAGGSIVSGLVPDGVVSVIAQYDASGKRPARTITSNVVNNVYVLKAPPATRQFPVGWQVRMSDGRVLSPAQLQARLGLPVAGGG